jgi:hypothetical protein
MVFVIVHDAGDYLVKIGKVAGIVQLVVEHPVIFGSVKVVCPGPDGDVAGIAEIVKGYVYTVVDGSHVDFEQVVHYVVSYPPEVLFLSPPEQQFAA